MSSRRIPDVILRHLINTKLNQDLNTNLYWKIGPSRDRCVCRNLRSISRIKLTYWMSREADNTHVPLYISEQFPFHSLQLFRENVTLFRDVCGNKGDNEWCRTLVNSLADKKRKQMSVSKSPRNIGTDFAEPCLGHNNNY